MILTKKAFLIGLEFPLEKRVREYKRWRKPKRSKPYSKLIAFVACYGELFDSYKNYLN